MANRDTTIKLKNSDILNRPLPSSLLAGEAIVNTADGIVLFSGITTASAEWTSSTGGTAGAGGANNFFEVGSNLYDLKLRNQITEYSGVTAGLAGQFLSGTSTGFVLADTNLISGSFTSFTVSGDTGSEAINDGDTLYISGGTALTTLVTPTDVLGISLDDTAVTAASYGAAATVPTYTVDAQGRLTAAADVSIDITASQVSDFTSASEAAIFTVANFVDSSTINFTATVGASVTAAVLQTPSTLSAGTGISTFTFNGSSQAEVALDTSYLDGRFVNITGDTMTGDLIIDGNLTILGGAVSAFTSQLYVEDPNIILNYNPTGTTNATSVNAGITIQDGDGASNDVSFDIVQMVNLTGLTAGNTPLVTEYNGLTTGYVNRGFITELNDIVIRSTDATDTVGVNAGDINGVRVLAEFDILDGGTF